MNKPRLSCVLALMLAGSILSAVADDVLQNGDFSEGPTHWNVDCRPLSIATGSTTPGAAVELRGTWTKLTQNFDAKKGHYELSVTFTMTPGTSFEKGEGTYRKIPKKLGFGDLKEFSLKRKEWCIIVTNLAAHRYEYCAIKPEKEDSSSQTMTGTIDLKSDGDQDMFCLAFPPGHGVVTLQSVSMTRK